MVAARRYGAAMPLIDVTCRPTLPADERRALVAALPAVVSEAVQCREEPYDGDLQPGDVLIRLREAGPFDRFDLDLLIEVHSKWFDDRAADRQRRADEIHDAVAALTGLEAVGVYLRLPTAAWAQAG